MLCSGPACSVGCTVPSSVQSSSSVRTSFSLPVNPTLNPTSFLASFPSSSSPGPSYSLVALSILAQSESRFRVLLSPHPHLQSIALLLLRHHFSNPSSSFRIAAFTTSFATSSSCLPANIRPSSLSLDRIFEWYEPCRQPTAPARLDASLTACPTLPAENTIRLYYRTRFI